MARKITKRQQQIYDFIRAYQQEKGYPPSVREMAAAVGLSSPSTAAGDMRMLSTSPWRSLVWSSPATDCMVAVAPEVFRP